MMNFLSTKNIRDIHETSLRILKEKGIKIHDNEVLHILEANKAKIDFKSQIAKFDAKTIENAIKKAPSKVTLYGRGNRPEMNLGRGNFYPRTGGGAPFILDIDTGKRRAALKKDAIDLAKIADSLENIYGVSIFQVVPKDIPIELVDIFLAEIAFNFTEKHLFAVCHNDLLIESVIQIAAQVAGGEAKLREKPLLTYFSEVTSPLQLVESQIKVIKTCAKYGVPILIHSHPIGGESAPTTIAGELALANAEALCSLTITQLISPGTPVIYGTSASVPDMRSGLNLAGAVENGLLGAAFNQLAHYYEIPSSMTAGVDSKIPDSQAAIERSFTALLPALSGLDLLNISAIDGKLTFSPEQLVIDNEIMGYIQKALQGIKVDTDRLALDVIKEVKIGGSYLDTDHTLKYFKEEYLISPLFSRERREIWEENGSLDLRDRAKAKAKKILQENKVYLDPVIKKGITDIINRKSAIKKIPAKFKTHLAWKQ